ncbi:phosphate ABC transporter permease PstA [Candidatus Thorarchaeota archaeon]|nr:MAG: phosphate ABC transporter permease PstA [Candidatus Thorarchaeota archaeon]
MDDTEAQLRLNEEEAYTDTEDGEAYPRMMNPLERWFKRQFTIHSKRDLKDLLFKFGLSVMVLIVCAPFFLILIQVGTVGFGVLLGSGTGQGLEFFLTTPGPGLQGGVLNAIVGTTYLVVIAMAVGVPLSVFGAIYITEYTRPGLVRGSVEFAADVLAGIPSIVFGAFGFTFLVVYLKIGMGMLAGGLTLAFMMIPTVLRTTQEALRQVPMSLREASLALGATKWTTTWKITIRAAFPGIVTGVLLAMGRVMGETAPLIFTSGNNLGLPTGPTGAASWVASMPYTVWSYISDPRNYVNNKAQATALTLMGMVLFIDLIANYISRKVTRRLV